MIHDNAAYLRERLNKHILYLDEIGEGLKGNNKTKKEAENMIRSSVSKIKKLESYIAYFWFRAKKEEAEKNNLNTNKEKYKTITTIIQDTWKSTLPTSNHSACLIKFGLVPDISDIYELPLYSFMLSMPFKLQKPYISKDEQSFYLIDNPIKKEKIFGTPMIASTGWKGALRYAFYQLSELGYPVNNKDIQRLFGNPRECDDFQAGRLCFYSSFFHRENLELINPHDRKTGISKRGPILIEAVPANQCTLFSLLYIPIISSDATQETILHELATDIVLVAQGIELMMTVYGFGAKTSSGYGVIENELPEKGGQIALNLPITNVQFDVEKESSTEEVSPRFTPDNIRSFHKLSELYDLAIQISKELRKGE